MSCNLCNGTGLIPFSKNGKTIPLTWQDCDCKGQQPEHYVPYSPDLIDFPVSWDYHRHYETYFGRQDPGSVLPMKPEPVVETTYKQTIVLDKKALELQQRIANIETTLKSITDKKRNKYIIK